MAERQVVREHHNHKLIIESEGNLLALISKFEGFAETTIYLYQDDLEKALELSKTMIQKGK